MAAVIELNPHQSLPDGKKLLLIQRRAKGGASIGIFGGGIKAVNLDPDATDADFDFAIAERQAEADREGYTICVIRGQPN